MRPGSRGEPGDRHHRVDTANHDMAPGEDVAVEHAVDGRDTLLESSVASSERFRTSIM
jgi:hypothetical protein